MAALGSSVLGAYSGGHLTEAGISPALILFFNLITKLFVTDIIYPILELFAIDIKVRLFNSKHFIYQ